MGKSLKSLAPVIGTAAGSFFGPAGAAVGGAIGTAIAGPGKTPKPVLANRSLYDVSKEAGSASSEYEKLLGRSRAASEAGAARAEVMKQMGEAALGRGPSLAETQLKAAQDRNLSQQLAAIQGSRAGSSALGQRALLQSMGSSGQDLAQQAALARLGERASFLQAAGAADIGLRSDIESKLGTDVMPKESMRLYDQNRVQQQNAYNQAKQAKKDAMMGAITGGLSSVVGGMASGQSGFKNPFSGMFASGTPQTRMPSSQDWYDAMTKKAEGGLVTKKNLAKKIAEREKLVGAGVLTDAERKKIQGYAKGGKAKAEHTTVIPDKGFGKIIIIDKNKEDDIKGYEEGGKVDSTTGKKKEKSWVEALEEAAQAVGSKIKDSSGRKQEDINEQRFLNPATKKAMGGPVHDYQEGGDVNGPGTETSDSIPALLSDGEFVIRAKEVKKPGILAHLEAINSGKITKKDLSTLAKAIQEREKSKPGKGK